MPRRERLALEFDQGGVGSGSGMRSLLPGAAPKLPGFLLCAEGTLGRGRGKPVT